MGSFTMNHNYKTPKQPIREDISIYLPLYDVELCSTKTDMPSKKLVKIYEKKVHIAGTLELDERDSTITNIGFENTIVNEICNKFKELKKSNVNYGNKGINPEIENGYEWSGSEYLTVEKFFDYLKTENREEIINSITND